MSDTTRKAVIDELTCKVAALLKTSLPHEAEAFKKVLNLLDKEALDPSLQGFRVNSLTTLPSSDALKPGKVWLEVWQLSSGKWQWIVYDSRHITPELFADWPNKEEAEQELRECLSDPDKFDGMLKSSSAADDDITYDSLEEAFAAGRKELAEVWRVE